jgi:hypothetical protein
MISPLNPSSQGFSAFRRKVLGAMLASAVLSGSTLAKTNTSGSHNSPAMTIELTFNGHRIIARLHDNPTARELYAMLPLELSVDSYGNNEKIAYLPRKLTEEGSGPFGNEAPGDIGYFAPWGNLAFYHGGYRWSEGLIRLGRIEGDIRPLLTPGKFRLEIRRFP